MGKLIIDLPEPVLEAAQSQLGDALPRFIREALEAVLSRPIESDEDVIPFLDDPFLDDEVLSDDDFVTECDLQRWTQTTNDNRI